MESINDGDVVIVDHDLENEETQITDTPEKSTRKKTISRVKSSFSRALVHINSKSWHIGKGIIKTITADEIVFKTLLFFAILFFKLSL